MRKFNSLAHRVPVLAAVIVATSALSGCATFAHRDSIEVGSIPDDYRTRHPIMISENRKQLMVPVGQAARELSFAEKEVISGFLSNYGSVGSGAIYVASPGNAQNAGAAGHVANQVAIVAAANGYQGRVIQSHYEASPDQATAPVIISYSAITASAGPCGKWPADAATDSDNKNYHNFGCAYQNNLAAMVANPMDLLGPRKPGPIDAADRDGVIGDYRTNTGEWSPTIGY